MERREFQIRTIDDYGQEVVDCYSNLADATTAYYGQLEDAQKEGRALEFELLEVLLQDQTKSES